MYYFEVSMPDKTKLAQIQKKIGYQFNNVNLLQQAFTRKSFVSRNKQQNNEILEFYGDRILDFIVTREFYNQYGSINSNYELVSSKTVGELSKYNIDLVRNTTLAQQMINLNFANLIRVRHSKERQSLKFQADLFEAILGAVALDSNWNLDSLETVYKNMMTGYKALSVNNLNQYKPGDGLLKLIMYRYSNN